MGESAKRFRDSVIVSLAVGLLAVAVDARAAHVHGAIVGFQSLLNPAWEEATNPDRHDYSFREPVPTVRAEFRRLYPDVTKEVCLAVLGATPTPPQKAVLVRVGGGRTTPVTIVVPPGTQIQFQNTDVFTHRLYGVGVATFAASDTVKGGLRSFAVPGPGTFEIRDEAAPSLRTFVIGDPNVVSITYPSSKGEYLLSVDAPGEYRVQAYFSGKKVGPELPIKVGTADLDLSRMPIKVSDGKNDKSDKSN
jgi:hypothetical protein